MPRRFAAFLVALPLLVAADAPIEDPIRPADREHWAFQPLKRPAVPAIDGGRTPIDAFLLERLHAKGLSFAPEAERLALLRRLYADLIGLPPTPEKQAAFLNDTRPDAYERLVEQLLASPHYGERWASHWFDVVRYAESNGYEADRERPQMWRYRDYVIRSLNNDKPYDQFLTEQLAGDELAAQEQDPRRREELWIAAGLHRCGSVHVVGGNADREVARQDVLTEMVQGVAASAFGLTLGCARCHDHKFDPISQADYFRLQAFFAATKDKDVDLASDADKAAYKAAVAEWTKRINPVKSQIAALDAPYRAVIAREKEAALDKKYKDALAIPAEKRTPEQKKLAADGQTLLKITWDEVIDRLTPEDRARRAALREQQHLLSAQAPQPPAQALSVADQGAVPVTHILKRGEVHKKGAAVGPAFPRVLLDSPPAEGKRLTRSDLAAWLTRPDHPLTARVMANRVWLYHFGHGIVATPNDFGVNGAEPSHRELLDWLAAEFVASGWSLKHLHRLMVLSAAYRQTSQPAAGSPALLAGRVKDPENALYWRMNRRRLEGEAVRDSMLTVAGNLTRQLGGWHIKVPLEPEVYALLFTEGEPDGLWLVTPDRNQHNRRTVYLFAKRNVRLPILEAFDLPDRITSCAVRPVSTFAPQALILMNGPFAREQARTLAATVWREAGADTDQQIGRLYQRTLARRPTAEERQLIREFLEEQAGEFTDRLRARSPVPLPESLPADADPARAAALTELALAVLNSNEFVYAP